MPNKLVLCVLVKQHQPTAIRTLQDPSVVEPSWIKYVNQINWSEIWGNIQHVLHTIPKQFVQIFRVHRSAERGNVHQEYKYYDGVEDIFEQRGFPNSLSSASRSSPVHRPICRFL